MSDSLSSDGADGPVSGPRAVRPWVRERLASRAFAAGCLFLLLSACFGLLLRWHTLRPVPGVLYAYVLHAHSHVALLGWVFNAFFALALRFFLADEREGGFRPLFIAVQIAVAGMAISYPIQGYKTASIAFSTLHMVCSGVFVVKLWRNARPAPAARGALRLSLVFLIASSLGPLALGPLAAAGLRDAPSYSLAIYFYLHCQYNGWFVFFLLAVLVQWQAERGAPASRPALCNAVRLLAAGAVLTFALSALWLAPPPWVRWAAAAGALLQVAALPGLFRALRGTSFPWSSRAVRGLAGVALGAFLVKLGLQLGATMPGLDALASHRFVVIGFLHLIFLGLATPLLFALGMEQRWLDPRSGAVLAGLGLYLVGAAVTAASLAWPPLAAFLGWPVWPGVPTSLLVGAAALAVGIFLISLNSSFGHRK